MKATMKEIGLAKSIGERIRSARKRRKISACELASKMTLSGYRMNQDGVLRIEKGDARLSITFAYQLFDMLGIDFDEFGPA